MASFGSLSIHLALLASALAAPLFLRAGGRNGAGLASARALLVAAAALLTAALSLLALAAVVHDFRIEYVASYTDRTTPLEYLATSIWAGQAGSLLFWATMLAWTAVLLSARLRRAAPELEPVAVGALALLACCFDAILVGWSNPFVVIEGRAVVDGSGLNPLLRNVMMVLHPPALLAGYVAYAAPAAIAAAALATRRTDATYLRELRRWSLVAWVLLTVGNGLGMVWAYGELGWGGYWGWDPVENSSLIPWLVGTALLHVVLREERSGATRGWTAPLALLVFWLTLLGTYLTRSGVVASVHSFGRTAVGDAFALLLVAVAVVVVAGIALRRDLVAWPRLSLLLPATWVACGLVVLSSALDRLGPAGVWVGPGLLVAACAGWALVPASRRSFPAVLAAYVVIGALAGAIDPTLWGPLALGLVLLAALARGLSALEGEALARALSRGSLLAAAAVGLAALGAGVLLGTLLPLLSHLVVGRQAQVGPEWYNAWAAPEGLVLLALTGLCLSLGGARPTVRRALRGLGPNLVAGAATLALAVALGVRSPLALGALGLAGVTGLGAVRAAVVAVASALARRKSGAEAGPGRLARRVGAALAHAGLAVLFFGLSGEAGKQEGDVVLEAGSPAPFAGLLLTLEGVEQRVELEREVLEAAVLIERPGRSDRRLLPARHRYQTHPDQPVSEASWLTEPGGDLFLALGRVGEGGREVELRAVLSPLLPWIWVGATMLALGGLVAAAVLLRPRWKVALALGASTAGVATLWIAARPAWALAALAALSVALAVACLALALVRPLWGLGPETPGEAPPGCPGCGVRLVDDSLFCHRCGARLIGDVDA